MSYIKLNAVSRSLKCGDWKKSGRGSYVPIFTSGSWNLTFVSSGTMYRPLNTPSHWLAYGKLVICSKNGEIIGNFTTIGSLWPSLGL